MNEGEMWATPPAPPAPATKAATCTDCGGPLDDGRYYRCVACVDRLWLKIERGKDKPWVARHRSENGEETACTRTITRITVPAFEAKRREKMDKQIAYYVADAVNTETRVMGGSLIALPVRAPTHPWHVVELWWVEISSQSGGAAITIHEATIDHED